MPVRFSQPQRRGSEPCLLDLRTSYLRHLDRKGCPYWQIRRHKRYLSKFIAWAGCRSIDWIDEIDPITLEDYRKHLDKPRSGGGFRSNARQQSAHLNSLRHWLYWAYLEEWSTVNLSRHVGEPLYRQRYHEQCSAEKQKQSGN